MAQRPDSGAPFHPLSIPFQLEGTNGDVTIEGTAIGLSFHGADIYYLVVNTLGESAPVWILDSQVATSYLAAP